jgi:endonuclease/exonuclease/phosphatase family metal-dependent hydrolase
MDRPTLRRVSCVRVSLLVAPALLWAALATVGWAETLTIATYNLENYGPANRLTADGYRTGYPKPETEKRAMRMVIRAINADVIMLQEMGDEAHLEELRRDLAAEGLSYPFARLATAADADRRVAILAKRPLQQVATHADLTFPYFGDREVVKRGVLEATIPTAAGNVTLFGIHLKSRFTDRADDPLSAVRRAGEARAIRERILQRFPARGGEQFLILGDCNDGRRSKVAGFLQKRGHTVVSVLLPAADSRGEIWTHAYQREESYSRVDLIFISPELLPTVTGGAARIYDGPGTRDASDHRPVVVVLNLEPRLSPGPAGTNGP